jgi:hypothetical protein
MGVFVGGITIFLCVVAATTIFTVSYFISAVCIRRSLDERLRAETAAAAASAADVERATEKKRPIPVVVISPTSDICVGIAEDGPGSRCDVVL